MEDVNKTASEGNKPKEASALSPSPRRSRRNNGEEPEFKPGSEIMILAAPKESGTPAKAKSTANVSEGAQGGKDEVNEGPSEAEEPERSAGLKESKVEVEDADEEDESEDEEIHSEVNNDQQNQNKTLNYDDQPVTVGQLDKVVNLIGNLVEERLKAFAIKAGLNPSVAEDDGLRTEEEHTESTEPPVKKEVVYLDPVKPSTVENLEDFPYSYQPTPEKKKTTFRFKDPVPPSRVDKWKAKEEDEKLEKERKGSARPKLSTTPSDLKNMHVSTNKAC